MKTLAIISQKGGSGKTTAALGLAVEAVADGRRVAIVDIDPQATAARWGDRRSDKESPVVVSCQASRLRQVLEAAEGQGVQLAIIDTPGKSAEAAIAAAKSADRVLIPIQPHLFDIETLESVGEILTLAGKPNAAIVVNRAPIQGTRAADAVSGLTKDKRFYFSPVVIYQRAAHGDSANVGLTAREFDPKSKAAIEMGALYRYITTML